MVAIRAKQIFVNLPVQDLKKSVEFFTKVGFEFDANFTDESATCMIIGDNIYAMLLVEERFQSFISKISNAADTTEVIVALSVDSREQVDVIVQAALDAGGSHPTNHRITDLCTDGVFRIWMITCGKFPIWISALFLRSNKMKITRAFLD